MRNWDLVDAAEKLSKVVDLALADGPQRVASHGSRAVVVLDEGEYQRLAGQVAAGAVRGFGGREIFEIMQNSPLAQGIRDGDIPEDWLERSQEASRHCECCGRRGERDRGVDAAD
ncbi:MAG TPA: hypothetical protein VF705_11160 [Longimicrobium sp.]|jgi:hypothetical protein